MIDELIKKHDLEYLIANAEVVIEQSRKQKITNPVGYLLKALQNDYRPFQNESKQNLDQVSDYDSVVSESTDQSI